MKRLLRRMFRIFICVLVLCSLFIAFLLNPQVAYGRVKRYDKVAVYSNKGCPEHFDVVLNKAMDLIKRSELYKPSFNFHVFLNDGSFFPTVPTHLFGDAFAWGYY